MILNEEQKKEFEKVVRPVMEFLGNPKIFHPHMTIVIETSRAEILEGCASIRTDDYVVD